jgi:hypothetical protein
MEFKVFFEDLNDEVVSRMKWALLCDLDDEINEAVNQGINRREAEVEVINDYLNRHNTGILVKI